MLPSATTASGTISSATSANSGLNRRRYGSLQVVPSGQTTRSPTSSSRRIVSPSRRRSRVSRTVGIGDSASETGLRLYVTATNFRRRAVAATMGSSRVRWLQA
ncbi:unnamed protein product [Spirodela intermedia]|uniref:Uncharacterized protein n=1 Tax=Spirodela intermedia TaxID=51605 RepID=A0A7I8K8M1_SPIIN|nr:unnamed protein product [Spirodela intermedia]